MRRISYAPAAAASAPPSFGETAARLMTRVGALLRGFARERARRRRIRETVEALMALDSRQLRDLGLSRTEILSAVDGETKNRRIDIRFDI